MYLQQARKKSRHNPSHFAHRHSVADGESIVLVMGSLSPRGDIVYSSCRSHPSITLSAKSTKFDSRYLVDRLSDGDEIWHTGTPSHDA